MLDVVVGVELAAGSAPTKAPTIGFEWKNDEKRPMGPTSDWTKPFPGWLAGVCFEGPE